jgi:hypothetical protein
VRTIVATALAILGLVIGSLPSLVSAQVAPAVTFGPGTKIVGLDVPPGTYRSNTNDSLCYWERLSGLGGTLGEIVANDNAAGPAVVAISETDRAFTSTRCAPWTSDLSPITPSPTTPFGAGTFIVGTDIAPGLWRSAGGSTCYWARLSGFGGSLGEIIANQVAGDSGTVQIAPGDKGFTSSRCGTWTKIG